ncbi:MAG: HEAT repeat domain-containing protein [Myxococcota bacterium]|nr:HEAT repeat domain-containing protein [Myxococcota bacterium]
MRKALALLLFATTAHAAPVGKASLDIDADGKLEDLELDADGSLRVNGAKRATLEIRAASASFEAAKTTSGLWLVIETGDKAYVVNARTWQIAATTELGGVGLDREYSIDVEATPEGVFRYQKRADVKRCDSKPAYLFAERLDAKGPATPPLGIPANAATLVAQKEMSPGVAPQTAPQSPGSPVIYHARAASHQPGASDAGALAIPRELDDGNIATVWRSGGDGQFFTFTPRVESAKAHALRIVPGNPSSGATMRQFNRPKSIVIVTARDAWRVELQDAGTLPLGTAFTIDLPQPVSGCVTVIIESVHGRPQGTTAIAELQVFAEGERSGGGEVLLARIVADGKGGDVAAAAALSKRGAAAAAALDAELGKATDAGARRRLIGALAKINDPAATPALVRAASSGWVRDRDLLDVIAALGASGQTQVLKELAAKGGSPHEVRIAAAAQIKPVGAGYDALVDLAGEGPRDVRRAVIERLALAPGAQLAQTAAAQAEATAAGDVWRALTRRARSHVEERATAATTMTTALASASDYERRYRLIDGVAAYGDAQQLRTLQATLSALPTAPQSSALRQVAVRSIASSPRTDATTIVITLARDADPGVRLAALSALASSETDAGGAWHAADGPDAIDRVIINGLTTDTWPEVRRRAAMALGARCQRPGPARALVDAVGKDPAIDVRSDSLTALVQCKAPGTGALLAKTWSDGKAPIELREKAVVLASQLEDPQLGTLLVAAFSKWRGDALQSASSLKLAQAAAIAIGALDARGAVDALMSALDDSAFPEIVSSAALGLGAMGKKCPAAAKAKLTLIARSGQQAANAARHAAGQCGR